MSGTGNLLVFVQLLQDHFYLRHTQQAEQWISGLSPSLHSHKPLHLLYCQWNLLTQGLYPALHFSRVLDLNRLHAETLGVESISKPCQLENDVVVLMTLTLLTNAQNSISHLFMKGNDISNKTVIWITVLFFECNHGLKNRIWIEDF